MSGSPKSLDAVTRMAFSFDHADRNGVAISEDVSVPTAFTALLQIRDFGDVQLDVKAEPGRVRVVHVGVTESPGDGVSNMTLARIPVQRLLETATRSMAWIYAANGTRSGSETQATARAASRRKMSDERIARVAKVLESGGGVAEVVASEKKAGAHIGERQAWRLIKRAREPRP